MKKGFVLMLVLSIMLGFTSCKKCRNEDPSAIIVNNGSENVSVQIQTSGGNTVNINNVAPTTASEIKTFAEGTVDFTISIGNNSPIVQTVIMEQCWSYEVIVASNNAVSTTAVDLND